MIVVPFAIFCLVLMTLCLLLFCVAIGRFARTPRLHPDRPARADMARLTVIAMVILGLALARSQFISTSRPFQLLSVALLPCGLAAIWLTTRLIGTYRRGGAIPADTSLPDVKAVQSRISPLSMERTNDDSRRHPDS